MKKALFAASILFSMSLVSAPPHWVDAGTILFEQSRADHARFSDNLTAEVQEEFSQKAQNMISECTPYISEKDALDLKKTVQKITEKEKLDFFVYTSLFFHLGSLMSPEPCTLFYFCSILKDMSPFWTTLSSTSDADWDRNYSLYYESNIRFNFFKFILKNGVPPEDEQYILPMFSADPQKAELGIKPLLKNSLEGYMPIILSPPETDDCGVHGGTITSPLDMMAHDFIHGLLVRSYFVSGPFKGIRKSILKDISGFSGDSELEQKQLLQNFLFVHEWTATRFIKNLAVLQGNSPLSFLSNLVPNNFHQSILTHIQNMTQGNDDQLLHTLKDTFWSGLRKRFSLSLRTADIEAFFSEPQCTKTFKIDPNSNQLNVCEKQLLMFEEKDPFITITQHIGTNQFMWRAEKYTPSDNSVIEIIASIASHSAASKNLEDFDKLLQLAGMVPHGSKTLDSNTRVELLKTFMSDYKYLSTPRFIGCWLNELASSFWSLFKTSA